MLISWNWTLLLVLVWSLHPVPSAVSVAPEAPGIVQTALIGGPTSETNHHSCSTAGLAEGCRVVNSHSWGLSAAVEFNPRKWRFFNA